jgi:hypothetical protein
VTHLRLTWLIVAAAAAAGCNRDVPRSTVTGTVTFRGQPLREAAVVFLASDNGTHALILDNAGRYRVDGVARGTVRVVVQPEPEAAATSRPERPTPIRAGGGETAKDAARIVAPPALKAGPPVPPKYARPETSGLSFQLTEPEQQYDLDLP